MNLKQRFKSTLAAFLLVATTIMPLGGSLLFQAYAAEGTDSAPAHSKKLTPNDDGTYELSLSVTGATQNTQTSEVTKANVVLVLDTSSSMVNNRTTYNGTRMTRLDAEKHALADNSGIIDNLLKQNVAGDPIKSDIIEVAIATFGRDGSIAQNFTSNKDTLKSIVNGLSYSTGTNWEEGLMRAQELAASIKTSQPNEDVYIVFMTDGEPTTHNNDYTVNTTFADEWACANDNARAIVTSGYTLYGLFTWGSGNSSHYLSSLINYAYTGSGNSNTALNAQYAQYFTDATDTEALIAALNQIVNDITNSVGYTDIEFTDEVTELTSTNISSAIEGAATGFVYKRSGGSYGDGQIWADAPAAEVVGKNVNWNLGDMVLEDGVTYTVSFTVWPSQDSYDLVADLNNGKKTYDQLTPDEKKQISEVDGKYYLKTNTDFPTISYSTITTTTVNGQSTTTKKDYDPINIQNPDPVGLSEEKLTLKKIWEDSLDPSQRDEVCAEDGTCEVVLNLKKDGNPYISNIVLSKDKNWSLEKYLAIAPGIMVSEGHPAYSENYPIVTISGTKYAILETGHDYEFEEDNINNHFELTHYKYHPMLVNNVLKNVEFIKEGNTITGVESVKDMTSISATNTIKGGINIQKKVVDENGREIPASDVAEKFNIIAHLINPNGSDYAYDYRIYCTTAHDNCTEEVKDESGAVTGYRTGHITGTGTINTNIYAQDTLRVVNVNSGTLFYVEESNIPTGYEQDGISYEISKGSTSNYESHNPSATHGGNTYYAVIGNAAAAATITNKYKSGSLKISKTVEVESGDKAKAQERSFKFTFKLYTDSSKKTELTGKSYAFTGSKSGNISSGDTIELAHGEYIEIAKLPDGAYYEVTEESAAGFETEKSGATGTIVSKQTKEAAFTNTYSVSGKAVIKAKKDLRGRNWLNGEKFTFTLSGNGISQTKTVGKDEIAEFELELTKDGTFTYIISEDTSNFGGGLVNTSEDIKIIVTATDKYDGTLDIAVAYPDEQNEAVVINTYSSKGSTDFAASKILTGRDWANGENYTFSMFDEKGNLIDELAVDHNGEYVFDEIEYTTKDAGKTFIYFIRETSTLPGGMTNSGEIKVTVTVTDNNDGTLTIDKQYTNNGTITNTYVAQPAEYTPEATKVLLGRDLKDKEFSFVVLLDGKEVATGYNDANGIISFSNPIQFTEIGNYTVTIKELKGDLENVTYDETVYEFTVSVTDDGNGKLVAKAEEAANDIVFINKYYDGRGNVPPAPVPVPVPEAPNTHDAGILEYAVLLVVSALGLVGSIFIAKRKSNDEE